MPNLSEKATDGMKQLNETLSKTKNDKNGTQTKIH